MIVFLVILAVAVLLLAGAAAGKVNSPSKQVHRPIEQAKHNREPDIDIQVRLSKDGRKVAEHYLKHLK